MNEKQVTFMMSKKSEYFSNPKILFFSWRFELFAGCNMTDCIESREI